MKQLLLVSLITLLALGTACGQAAEPEPVTSDGIQVHGHWTVTVTNPDGTVDAVHEFDNELGLAGQAVLSAFLVSPTINIDQSEWNIVLMGNAGPGKSLNEGLDCAEQKTVPDVQMGVFLPANVEKATSSPEMPVTIRATCLVEKADAASL